MMHEKFQLAQSRRQFARLLNLCEEQERQLTEDPRPFLDHAYKEISKTRRALDDVKAALYGTDEMVRWDPSIMPRFESPEAKLHRRIEKAKAVIAELECPSERR